MNDAHCRGVSRQDIRRFGTQPLDHQARVQLGEVTARLLASSPTSLEEFERYLGVLKREIALPHEQLTDTLPGQTVLVTGDSGCIGSMLVNQLALLGVRRVVGASLVPSAQPRPGVSSVRLDIRDATAVRRLFEEITPDVVFHLAAQRDPGLAERSVRRTISTNMLGTCNVVRACERAGVRRLVYASTGKALRPYTRCVYAATKRVSERIVADAAVRGAMHTSAVRFTHVVDNAILLERLRRWCRAGSVIRLHSLDTVFYAQSAVESAQLLLLAAAAPDDDIFRVHAIRDLDWPLNLLDLALGALAEYGNVVPVPIQEIGCEPGYEQEPYPGLYDPTLSGSVSPLFNAMEAAAVRPTASPDVDAAHGQRRLTGQLRERIDRIDQMAMSALPVRELRVALDDLALADLRQSIDETSVDTLHRIDRFTRPYRKTMLEEHRRIDDAIRQRLALVTLRNGRHEPSSDWPPARLHAVEHDLPGNQGASARS